MESYLLDWINLGLRWLHVIAAIAWVGSSFYFVALDASLKPPVDPELKKKGVSGEAWAVHGGGFYNPQKYLVAPSHLPEDLHWSKWEAYTTWLSGFGLLLVLYLFNPNTYLVDKSIADITAVQAVMIALGTLALGWLIYDGLCRICGFNERLLAVLVFIYIVAANYFLTHVFSGRAAFLMAGAMIATMMAANVFFWIIPGQHRVVAALQKGEEPNPLDGKRGKQRSVHNNYLTLPVVFAMLSNHYAFTYSHAQSWIVLTLVMAAGAVVRQFFNLKHKGKTVWSIWLISAALIAVAFWLVRPQPVAKAAADAVVPTVLEVQAITAQRCITCHAAQPKWAGFASAPAGVKLETADEIKLNAKRVYEQSVVLKAMPLGNVTQITDAERDVIRRWYEAGAS